eukprot:5398170-Ditylum_brightwellii.AAC.1
MKCNIVTDCAVGAPDHGKDIIDGLNAVDKTYLNKMMFIMYNPGSKHTAKGMMAHLCTPSKNISYASKFRDLLQDRTDESNLHTSNARANREENAKCKVRHCIVEEKNM